MSHDYFTELDLEIFERELNSFIPSEIFDSHAHLYQAEHFAGGLPASFIGCPESATLEVYRNAVSQIFPGRRISGLFFGFPDREVDFEVANDFVSREVRQDEASRGLMLVHPSMNPESIRETVRKGRFVGLKCYHVYAPISPTLDSSIKAFLPESQVELAHEERLVITLHIVRSKALSDSLNQEVIRYYCERYPDARIILAHAARGFNPYHTIYGIDALRGLGNVWFDTSAITEPGAVEAIIRTFGPGRVLYGSDFPISHQRGKCVAFGDSFIWFGPDNTPLSTDREEVQLTLVGIESLRILKLASMNLGLSDSEVEAIFFKNAATLFSI